MRPNEKLKTPTGIEVFLFPLTYMYISQGEHQEKALDFLGWTATGRVYNAPCYAPFSMSCVYTGNDHNGIFWSDNPVLFADGEISHATILVAHSSLDIPVVGRRFSQGDLFYHTGNYGLSTGDHLHFEVSKGHVMWDSTGLHLQNPVSVYNATYVNDTTLIETLGYNFRTYQGRKGKTKKPKKFPFVLYSRKFRNSLYR